MSGIVWFSSGLPPSPDIRRVVPGRPVLTHSGHRVPYFQGSGNRKRRHVSNNACGAQGRGDFGLIAGLAFLHGLLCFCGAESVQKRSQPAPCAKYAPT